MEQSTKSQTETGSKPDAWLKPDQVDQMRTATVTNSPDYLSLRNDSLIALMYDTGLRVSETVALDIDLLDFEEGILRLPSEIQKQFPTEQSPDYVEMELASDTLRTLEQFLSTRWKDGNPVFPSRESDRMTTESIRNVVGRAARHADVRPYTLRGRGKPSDVTPHTLRHSVAYRMLSVKDGYTLYDVTKRLRHATIQTTEQIYSHFDRV